MNHCIQNEYRTYILEWVIFKGRRGSKIDPFATTSSKAVFSTFSLKHIADARRITPLWETIMSQTNCTIHHPMCPFELLSISSLFFRLTYHWSRWLHLRRKISTSPGNIINFLSLAKKVHPFGIIRKKGALSFRKVRFMKKSSLYPKSVTICSLCS